MNISLALSSAGIDRSDAEILLAAILQKDRAFLLAHPDQKLTTAEQSSWGTYLKRRKKNEPISYIVGEREFYGRTFFVDRRVHIPRPSTENLVAMVLAFLKKPQNEVRELEPGIIGVAKILRDYSRVQTVVDVGTGSGCIAITLALERPDLYVIAIDISTDALQVAKENAKRLGARNIEFLEGDLLAPVAAYASPFIVVSNPPYIPLSAPLNNEVRNYEPAISLRGGKNGDEIIRKISDSAADLVHCSAYLMESLTQQT